MPGPPSVTKADAIAISGWDEDHPAPRLNLQPNPFATIHLAKQIPAPLTERGRLRDRGRLWQRWLDSDPEPTVHAAAARR